MRFKLFVPGRTVAKARPRASVGKNGKPFMWTPAKTAQMENVIRDRTIEWMETNGLAEPHDGPVRIVIVNLFQRPKDWWDGREPMGGKGDWENLAKTVCDAMNKILFRDDAQIIDGRSIKRYADRPGVYIVAELLPLVEKPKKERKARGR